MNALPMLLFLNTLAGAAPPAVCEADRPAARVGGDVITIGAVDAEAGNALLALRAREHRARAEALEALIDAAVLAREAALRKTTVEDVRRTLLPAGPSGPATASARRAAVQSLRRKHRVEILLEPPRIEVASDDDPARGPSHAPVEIVEFADFLCPYCVKAAETLRAVAAKYPAEVRIVFRDFPLPIHAGAGPAAEAGRCAAAQGRFWEMHDLIFARQKALDRAALAAMAGEIGLDRNAFDSCMAAPDVSTEWKRDLAQGKSYGVASTPTLFVNGRMLVGPASTQALVDVIEEELQRVRQGRAPGNWACSPGPRLRAPFDNLEPPPYRGSRALSALPSRKEDSMRLLPLSLFAAALAVPATAQAKLSPIEREIKHELTVLPRYDVFDHLAFKVESGGTVTLLGSVRSTGLKGDAERAVKDVPGVTKVVNQIEVLPASPNDDQIRMALWRRFFGDGGDLTRYALRVVPSIHIIVHGGKVRLEGVVGSEVDRKLAEMRARELEGVTTVTNNLVVESD